MGAAVPIRDDIPAEEWRRLARPASRPNPQPQPPIGQTVAAEGAPASAAALLQSVPELRLKTKRT